MAEILYRKIENRYGLPAARRQERIDAGGSRYHLDVWYETWRVWVEIDGGYHREARQWWDDLARQNAGVLQDRLILRFPVHVLRTNRGWWLNRSPQHYANAAGSRICR